MQEVPAGARSDFGLLAAGAETAAILRKLDELSISGSSAFLIPHCPPSRYSEPHTFLRSGRTLVV